ncbi:heme o synthase [bacterium]|nr:heme o synthase [bacterium]
MISSIKYYFQLLKFRLSFTVVISATAGYLIGVENFDYIEIILLTIGGFLVTGSANGFNQILEKDHDKLMLRTMHRPLPQKKLTTLNALFFSFIIGVLGLYLLSMIKPHGSFYGFLSKSSAFGLLSLMIYVLSYTPLKRMSTVSIFVGAIPGAIPVLLGWVAATDDFGLAVGLLFAIQFLWQFPHFISISWIRDDEYKKAGFKMMYGEEKGKYSAVIALITSTIMTIVSVLPFFLDLNFINLSTVSFILVLTLGFWFTFNCYKLLKKPEDSVAKNLMISSLVYLPFMQLIYVMDKWIVIWFL